MLSILHWVIEFEMVLKKCSGVFIMQAVELLLEYYVVYL